MKIKVVLFIVLGLFINCEVKVHKKNIDLEKAENLIEKFDSLIQVKNYNDAQQLFDRRFFEVTSSDSLNLIFSHTNKKLGNLEDKRLIDYQSTDVDSMIQYVLVYQTTFSKFKAIETFSLIQQKNKDVIKIVGYEVDEYQKP